VPEILDLALKEREFRSGYLGDLGGPSFVAFSLGLMARGHPEVVRKIESRINASNGAMVLETLKYCGDQTTLELLRTSSSGTKKGTGTFID
jgi:hypothetical protein